MRKFIALLLIGFTALTGWAADSANIAVSVLDFGQNPLQRRSVTLTPLWPLARTISTNLFSTEPKTLPTSTNGLVTFTNTAWGVYKLYIAGSGQSYALTLGTNANGTVSAASLVTDPQGLPPSPTTNYYTQGQIDSLLASFTPSSGGAATNVYLSAAGANIAINTNGLLYTFSVYGLAGTNDLQSATNLLALYVGTNYATLVGLALSNYLTGAAVGTAAYSNASAFDLAGTALNSTNVLWSSNRVDATFHAWVNGQSASGISDSTATNIARYQVTNIIGTAAYSNASAFDLAGMAITNLDTRIISLDNNGSTFSGGFLSSSTQLQAHGVSDVYLQNGQRGFVIWDTNFPPVVAFRVDADGVVTGNGSGLTNVGGISGPTAATISQTNAANATNALYTTLVTYTDNATNGVMTAATNSAKSYTDAATNSLSGVLVTRIGNATNDLNTTLRAYADTTTNSLSGVLVTRVTNATNDLSGVLRTYADTATNQLSGVLVTQITAATNNLGTAAFQPVAAFQPPSANLTNWSAIAATAAGVQSLFPSTLQTNGQTTGYTNTGNIQASSFNGNGAGLTNLVSSPWQYSGQVNNSSVGTAGRITSLDTGFGGFVSVSSAAYYYCGSPVPFNGWLSNLVTHTADGSLGAAFGAGTNSASIVYTNGVASGLFTLTQGGAAAITNSGSRAVYVTTNDLCTILCTNSASMNIWLKFKVRLYP